MANFALNYSFSRNLNIPLDEDAVKSTYAEVLTYVQTKSKCYAGPAFEGGGLSCGCAGIKGAICGAKLL